MIMRDQNRLAHQDVELEFGRRAGTAQFHGFELAWVNLTHVPEVSLAKQQFRGAAGCEQRDRHAPRGEWRGNVQPLQNRLDDALEPAEIAARHEGQPRRLVGQRFVGSGQIDVGHLEERRVGVAVRLVVPARQAGWESGSGAARSRACGWSGQSAGAPAIYPGQPGWPAPRPPG